MNGFTSLSLRVRTWIVLLLAVLLGTQSAMAQTKEAYAYSPTADRSTFYFYYDTYRASRNTTGVTFGMNTGSDSPFS